MEAADLRVRSLRIPQTATYPLFRLLCQVVTLLFHNESGDGFVRVGAPEVVLVTIGEPIQGSRAMVVTFEGRLCTGQGHSKVSWERNVDTYTTCPYLCRMGDPPDHTMTTLRKIGGYLPVVDVKFPRFGEADNSQRT